MECPSNEEHQIMRFDKNNNSNMEITHKNTKNIKINNMKNNKILTKVNKNNKVPIPFLIQHMTNKNTTMKNKIKKLNKKDLLIRAFSYKTIENNNDIEKTNNKPYKYINNKQINDSDSFCNIKSNKSGKTLKLFKENLTSELNITDINQIFNKNKNIIYGNINKTNNNNNIKNIVSSLTSKNKVLKRNIIPNLKNTNVFNKNTTNSNFLTNKLHKHNYSSIQSSCCSTSNSNIKKNYVQNYIKLENKDISNKNNKFINLFSPKSNNYPNKNILKTKTYYILTNNQTKKQNKVNDNYEIKKKSVLFKNCRSQIYKKFDSSKNTLNDNDSSRINYIKTSNTITSINNKIKGKKRPNLKFNEDNIIKDTILDNKLKIKFLEKNKTERESFDNENFLLRKTKLTSKINTNSNKTSENIQLKEMKKLIFNNKLKNIKAKKLLKKDKILSLTNANNTYNSIINFKANFNNKYIPNIGALTSRIDNININKIYKTNNNNNLENTERLSSYRNMNDSNNISFIKKLGNKVNYLNINLNTLSNINNTTICNNNSNNSQNIVTPSQINSFNDNSILFKKKLKNKFTKKKNVPYANKSLINSNNNIIILNNISMNNLNNISIDYLSKISTKKLTNSYKNFESLKKKLSSYVSKEKDNNVSERKKQLEKKREYYNNQKKIYKKNNPNFKKNNRIKEQNLNEFNLRQSNIMKKRKDMNNHHKFINHNKINSSINFNHIYKQNVPSELLHINNCSNKFNPKLSTNKNNTNFTYMLSKNNSTSNNQTIGKIIKNLREKIKNGNEKLKINSVRISPKKIHHIQPLSKNNNSLNPIKTFRNSYHLKNKLNKKNVKEKNIVTIFNDYFKIGKKMKKNCLTDMNEEIIEKIKSCDNNLNSYKCEKTEKENNKKSYKSFSIDDKIKKNKRKIKIIKKHKKKLFNSLNKLRDSLDKNDNNITKDNIDIFKTPDNDKTTKEINNYNKDKNPQLAEEYTIDIIESLLEEENYYFNEKKYINPLYLDNEDSELTPEMRTIAVDWLVLIHFKIFKFTENTLFLAIQIFDRYLSKVDLNTEQTELLLYTSFMLASKHNEIDYMNMQETLKLSQDKFVKEQVVKMESEILNKLDFEILAPTMCEFFILFASYLNLNQEKINQGLYILNIILVDFHMLKYPNFMLSFAVIKLINKKVDLNLENLIKNILKDKKLEKFLNIFKKDEYEKICKKIKLLFDTFLETKYKNIQEKFADKEYNSVSKYTSI